MNWRRALPAALFAVAANSVVAGGVLAEPASAIPWLTDSLRETGTQIRPADSVGPVREEAIGGPSNAGIGVLTPQMSGLPGDMWGNMGAQAAGELLRKRPRALPPAAQALYLRMLLTETQPPRGAGEDFLIARVDRLLEIGALDQAEALLDRAGANSPALFRRLFDVEILTGHGDRACAALQASPMLTGATRVRIFCLARNGDWDAASIALLAAERIDAISSSEADLLALFIDPDLIEEIAAPAQSEPMQALEFVIRETVGLPISRTGLPNAFLHADTALFVPIRFRMEAAERLVTLGALPPAALFAAYREEVPAASGGVWDRAAAVQALDDAGDPETLAAALLDLDGVMAPVGLRAAAAVIFAPLFRDIPPENLPSKPRALAARYIALSGSPLAEGWVTPDTDEVLSAAAVIADGDLKLPSSLSPRTYAVLAPFLNTAPADVLDEADRAFVAAEPVAAILLRALSLLYPNADAGDLSRGLALLQVAGQEKVARQVAIELLLLGQGARVLQ